MGGSAPVFLEGFRVWGFEFKVQGLGQFRVQGLGFRAV